MKKLLISLLLISTLLSAMFTTVAASEPAEDPGQIPAVAEEQLPYVWKYRNYFGVMQKRLFDPNTNTWLTDWMDC